MPSTYDLITHERLAALAGVPAGEEPVVSLYLAMGPGSREERRLALKNLTKQGEEQARRDTGFDEERRKKALGLVERTSRAAEETLQRIGTARGAFVAFAKDGMIDSFRLPVPVRDRIVVDRTPYASPLSSVLDQYERYGVVMADQRRGRILEVYLGAIVEWETLDETSWRRLPKGGGHEGLEEARRRHHGEYLVHRHLQHVADRAFAQKKRHGFDQLIVVGPHETLPRLEERLHPYLRSRIVARDHWPLDLPKNELLARVLKVEEKVEAEKERALLAELGDHLGGDLLATTGCDETLRALYFGKVATLVVEDGAPPLRGRQCPECRYLLPRPEDAKETSPTLIECPLCKRPTQAVLDVIDQAVELAIQSGSKVEHVAYAKEGLKRLGGMASILRFK